MREEAGAVSLATRRRGRSTRGQPRGNGAAVGRRHGASECPGPPWGCWARLGRTLRSSGDYMCPSGPAPRLRLHASTWAGSPGSGHLLSSDRPILTWVGRVYATRAGFFYSTLRWPVFPPSEFPYGGFPCVSRWFIRVRIALTDSPLIEKGATNMAVSMKLLLVE